MTVTTTATNHLTPEEAASVAQLRQLVQEDLTPFYDTDFNLLRWLQGHAGSVEEVAKKLRAHLKMRKSSWKLDDMASAPRTHPIHGHWRYGITGDSQVLPNVVVNIEQCGSTDYWGMMQTHSIQEVMKARVPDLEDMLRRCMQVEAATGKQASILYVMDCTGLQYNTRLYNLIRGALRALSEFMAEHYVELIRYFVLVNVPSFVYAIWTVTKPILPEKTRQKVRILSPTWRQEILEYASPKALPARWNDEHTTHFAAHLDAPVPFPEENYFSNQPAEAKESEKLRVVAGKTLIVCKELKKGEKLHWHVSADAELGLGIFFSGNKNEQNVENMETCYPCFEWMPGPTTVPLCDHIVAREDGIYRVWFSNARAWWHTLTVHARIHVQPADAA